MSTADRSAVLAIIMLALAIATGRPGFWYLTVALWIWAFIALSVTLRAERRERKAAKL